MNMKSSTFAEFVKRINELEEENEQLKKWCEEFNALNVSKENQKLKELLKECRDELEGEFGIGAAKLVEEIDEVLKGC